MKKNMHLSFQDSDSIETQEWLEALASLIRYEGKERASYILQQLIGTARKKGVSLDLSYLTSSQNTIPVHAQPPYPGSYALEARIEACIRWNAMMMVMRAKKKCGGIGGHLSSFASIATLYEVGMNHFFKGATATQLGDLIYFQGHSAEGNYARAYLEDRLSEQQLNYFRQEVDRLGVSSYPHPWLMPHFWQFATVSLGLGPLQGVYQARFLKYLMHRELLSCAERKVWVFCGDGEMDEPESIAGLSLAGREKLDNLIFVVNCNLQRLDGLVRSNGKIIDELEHIFLGARWNVIKVLWGGRWDDLFAKDKAGLLEKRLSECVDGTLQTMYVRGGAYMREHLFNTDALKALVADWSDVELSQLDRGAHDPIKIYAAYAAATQHKGQPTVILALGVKGYGLGIQGAEGRNVSHNYLDLSLEELQSFCKRFYLPLTDEQLESLSFYKPDKQSEELQYLHQKRAILGGYIPERQVASQPLMIPELSVFNALLQSSGERTLSTTMLLGRFLNILLKDQHLTSRIVPIFSDEVRTFGLEALFRQVGIYSSVGQLYLPEDSEQFLYYHEAQNGQILEEGITEAGCMASWLAAATAYANHRFPMIAFFIYYSMFGFQRVGDLIWAAGDMRARGFLIGATAGRTTLEGEGLQHQDGQSLLVASTVPNCKVYDPAFGYELAVIMQQGLKEMYEQEQDVFYYITVMNERYLHPKIPESVEEGIVKGIYLLQSAPATDRPIVQLFGSGAILNEVLKAAELLAIDFDVRATVWSVTSFVELYREGCKIERLNRLIPTEQPQKNYLEHCLKAHLGPIVAATDYVKAYADLIRPYLISRTYITLGTDGFGRSDTRAQLRHFFEVDCYYIVIAALDALVKEQVLPVTQLIEAMQKYHIDVNKRSPVTV